LTAGGTESARVPLGWAPRALHAAWADTLDGVSSDGFVSATGGAVSGDLGITGALTVQGPTTVDDLEVTGALIAPGWPPSWGSLAGEPVDAGSLTARIQALAYDTVDELTAALGATYLSATGGTVSGSLTATGSVRVGDQTLSCAAGDAAAPHGTLRWRNAGLELCSPQGWRLLYAGDDGATSGTAAASCKAIRDAGRSRGTGAYWLRGSVGDPYLAWCEMVKDGGGWTLVVRVAENATNEDFRWAGRAWTEGEGNVLDWGASHVSLAWRRVTDFTHGRFERTSSGASTTGAMSDCAPAGSALSSGSGACAAFASGTALFTTVLPAYAGSSHSGFGLSRRSPTSVCAINARIYLSTSIWDGGDSEVVSGAGYDYKAGNQYSASCNCPYSTYCGEGLNSGGNTVDDNYRWTFWVR
jgi:hypothetical protein